MKFFSLLSPRRNRLASTFVLVASLLLVGVQSLEAGHNHAADDAFEQCLLCKSSADPQLTTQFGDATEFSQRQVLATVQTLATQTSYRRNQQPRAPPQHS